MDTHVLRAVLVIGCLLLSGCTSGGGLPETAPDATPTGIPTPSIAVRFTQTDVFCPTANEKALRAYNAAQDAEETGSLDKAESLYRDAIEHDPHFCDAMDNLGVLLRRQGRIDEAIGWYRRSLAVFPANTVAQQNIALALMVQGDYLSAAKEYQQLIEMAPDNPEGHFGLANAYLVMEQPERAIECLETAQDLYAALGDEPHLIDVRFALGTANFHQGEYDAARRYLLAVYPRLGEEPGVNYYLGLCYLTEESYDLEQARHYLGVAQSLGVELPAPVRAMIE
ncbi:MAG: tetratricopeptide repeat protein [Caldilinea sp.]|nr:tetratricopeptide repeat protein [Caldilinea sp.]MCB0068816.1 tetratricopeptide repeat protein [Caldilineaceae bacterium]MCB9114893.1 tetratricopeptide repeat protein [Caldilineaceae bacterium]MCB9123678.1 tetratricopeptide repeat protein [Caldilineaceae bacterium]MCO5214366.1 tetratricopeptide repeat protein [Caldilinea sp.]